MSQSTIVETDTSSIETESTRQSQSEHAAALDERCAVIRHLLSENEGRNSRAYYKVGVEVVAVKSDEGRYGKGSVERMAAELGRTAALLYSYAKVAETWPEEKRFLRLAGEHSNKKLPLSFTHFVELAKIADEEKREELRRAALKECWSVAKLRQAMAEPADPEPKSGVHSSVPSAPLPTGRLATAFAEVEAAFELVSTQTELDAAELESVAREARRLQELLTRFNARIIALRGGQAGEGDTGLGKTG